MQKHSAPGNNKNVLYPKIVHNLATGNQLDKNLVLTNKN